MDGASLRKSDTIDKSAFERAPKGSGDLEIPAGVSLTFHYQILFLEEQFDPDGVHWMVNE